MRARFKLLVFVFTAIFVFSGSISVWASCAQSFARLISTNAYNTGRGIDNYNTLLLIRGETSRASFEETLQRLAPDSLWVDMGAGEARALSEGLQANSQIRGIGIAHTPPGRINIEPSLQPRLQYLSGALVDEMDQMGSLRALYGQADLISDVYGPLSYTDDFARVLQIYMKLLKRDGELHFNLMNQRLLGVSPQGEPAYVTVNAIGAKDAQLNGVLSWLRSIRGIEVHKSNQFMDSRTEQSLAFVIRKTADDVEVPQNLQLVRTRRDTPPLRYYEQR